MFEQLGPGNRALLGNVADQHHRHPAGLGEVLESGRHLAHLAHRSCDSIDVIENGGLDRIHHHQSRLERFELAEHRVARGFREQQEPLVQTVNPSRAQGHLLGGLLAGHIDDWTVVTGELGCHLQEQRRLADPGLTGEQYQRSWHQSPAENPIEAIETGCGETDRGCRCGFGHRHR